MDKGVAVLCNDVDAAVQALDRDALREITAREDEIDVVQHDLIGARQERIRRRCSGRIAVLRGIVLVRIIMNLKLAHLRELEVETETFRLHT